jgi:hypothetical protein
VVFVENAGKVKGKYMDSDKLNTRLKDLEEMLYRIQNYNHMLYIRMGNRNVTLAECETQDVVNWICGCVRGWIEMQKSDIATEVKETEANTLYSRDETRYVEKIDQAPNTDF